MGDDADYEAANEAITLEDAAEHEQELGGLNGD